MQVSSMARPPLFPDQSAAGIAVDPRTLERVIPESKRADGTYVASQISSASFHTNDLLCFALPVYASSSR